MSDLGFRFLREHADVVFELISRGDINTDILGDPLSFNLSHDDQPAMANLFSEISERYEGFELLSNFLFGGIRIETDGFPPWFFLSISLVNEVSAKLNKVENHQIDACVGLDREIYRLSNPNHSIISKFETIRRFWQDLSDGKYGYVVCYI